MDNISEETDLLKAWKEDAAEFEIPENTQRGLAFMLALNNIFDPPSQNPDEQIEFVKRFSPHAPNVPEFMGGNFYDATISELLAEFAHKADPDFKSRVIKTEYGSEICCFKRPKVDRLPTMNINRMNLSSWDSSVSSLFEQIGQNIEEDIEGAYLAGFNFSSSYYHSDNKGTTLAARIPNSVKPPHFSWFTHCISYPAEEIRKGNGMQKVIDCFLGDVCREIKELYTITCWLSDQLHYQGPGEKRDAIWNADLASFTGVASTAQLELDKSDVTKDWLPKIKQILNQKGVQAPQDCNSAEEAINAIAEHVKKHWGYDVLSESDELYASQQWVRRACIVYACSVFSALNPSWNSACAKK